MTIIKSAAVTKITNLRLQTVIGCNDWERNTRQEIIVNIEMTFNPQAAIESDRLEATLDYRAVKKRIIASVSASSFNLLESLTAHILDLIMEYPLVQSARVTVDKPKALRFADSVSIALSAQRET
jgi:D-erythro-7,8-dihydroneopterin triphosphate epimerase